MTKNVGRRLEQHIFHHTLGSLEWCTMRMLEQAYMLCKPRLFMGQQHQFHHFQCSAINWKNEVCAICDPQAAVHNANPACTQHGTPD